MAKFNVTNRKQRPRSFMGGGRWLTLAGGETERGVELSDDEKKGLEGAGNDFHVREIKDETPRRSSAPATDVTASRAAGSTRVER